MMLEDAIELLHFVRAYGSPFIADQLGDLLTYSIRMQSHPLPEEAIDPGTSKIGGLPDMPGNMQWPEWNGTPLSFVAQINLPEITTYDFEQVLPKEGILYFFFDTQQRTWGFPGDQDGWRVLYFKGDRLQLHRTTAPMGLPSRGQYVACVLEFSGEAVLPSWVKDVLKDFYRDLGMETEQPYDIWGLAYKEQVKREKLNGQERYALWLRLARESHKAVRFHRLLGYPDEIQGDMQIECHLHSHGISCNDPQASHIEEDALQWRFLCQIDSDEDAGMLWGDSGRIYYWIRSEALTTRAFDQAWCILQCY